jgi:hypothetical protein
MVHAHNINVSVRPSIGVRACESNELWIPSFHSRKLPEYQVISWQSNCIGTRTCYIQSVDRAVVQMDRASRYQSIVVSNSSLIHSGSAWVFLLMPYFNWSSVLNLNPSSLEDRFEEQDCFWDWEANKNWQDRTFWLRALPNKSSSDFYMQQLCQQSKSHPPDKSTLKACKLGLKPFFNRW